MIRGGLVLLENTWYLYLQAHHKIYALIKHPEKEMKEFIESIYENAPHVESYWVIIVPKKRQASKMKKFILSLWTYKRPKIKVFTLDKAKTKFRIDLEDTIFQDLCKAVGGKYESPSKAKFNNS